MLKQLIFSECADQFITAKTTNLSKKTIRFYKGELRYFMEWLQKNGYENPTLADINPIILRKWFADLGTHRNRGGVHGNYRSIKCFMNWIWNEYDLEVRNPIKKVKVDSHKIPPLPEIPITEVQKLLDVSATGYNELRDKSILKTLIDTGARATELISLNVEDINLQTGSVHIKRGKGGKSRIVWLGKSGLKSLKEYLKTRPNAKPEDPLFMNTRGGRLGFFGLRMIIKRLCDRAEIKVYGLHAFRRCFALSLYRKTKDVFLVSKLLGHANLEVTLRYLNVGNSYLGEVHSRNSPADLLD